MAREKTYKFKMKNPNGKKPKDGWISEIEPGVLMMPRLLRPNEIKKYNLIDLNEGYTKLTIYRSSINMRQDTLSMLTGIPVKTIQGWELRGLNEAKVTKALKIADALKCNVRELLEDENQG